MVRAHAPQRAAKSIAKYSGKKRPNDKYRAASVSAWLPRLWARFRTSPGASSVPILKAELCKWIEEEMFGSRSDGNQQRLPRSISKSGGACLVQRMGFRFKDPSPKGSWSVENLQGFSERIVGPSGRCRTQVEWSDYVASLSLQEVGAQSFQLRRVVKTRAVAVIVEKFKQGGNAGPLMQAAPEKVMINVTACSRRQEAESKRQRIKVVRKAANLLPAVVMWPAPPAVPPQWTLIYLHGLGGSALGNYADKPHYFFDGTVSLKVVVPTAPSREVSCYPWWHRRKSSSGGPAKWHLQKFLSWYDYTTDNNGKREDELDLESLHAIRTAIHSLIKQEAALLGGRPERVILGGKSQGCSTALDAALTYPEALGGFIGLVGHLLSCTPVDPDGIQKAIPIHFFHEVEDKVMQWKWVEATERRLRDVCHNLHSRHSRDPEGRGHFIEGVEGRWIRTALKSICEQRC